MKFIDFGIIFIGNYLQSVDTGQHGYRKAKCVLPVALLTLQYEVILCVLSLTDRTAAQTGTQSTETVVTLPITVQPRGGRPTLHTPHTPAKNILLGN